jgi:hypothetical protein
VANGRNLANRGNRELANRERANRDDDYVRSDINTEVATEIPQFATAFFVPSICMIAIILATGCPKCNESGSGRSSAIITSTSDRTDRPLWGWQRQVNFAPEAAALDEPSAEPSLQKSALPLLHNRPAAP